MARNLKNFFGLLGGKSEAPGSSPITAFEETRGGLPKAYIPNFFYKAPFGYPRYKDLSYYRTLAASIYVDMCETAIIDEVCSVPWGIVAEDDDGNEILGQEKGLEVVRSFFRNPNTNPESWETIVRMMLPDLLELNSGILVKVFNAFGQMVEIVARDGIAFTKNPDIYGMFTNRADLILVKNIMGDRSQSIESGGSNYQYDTFPLYGPGISEDDAREEGAYFQYGWNSAARPVPYGKREIVWLEKKVRTEDLYGRSAMEVLSKTVQTLIYAVEHNLEYFNDNSIPPGVLGLDGLSTTDMKAFATQWIGSQKKQDDLGNWKKAFHKLAIVNKVPKFERLGFTNQELELIESQKWWSKMVWASFGITATELGFTEDAKGSANQIVQTSIAKKRIIYPLLRLIEYYVNTQIIPEFGYPGIKYKYKIFDVDEQVKIWGLYKLQTESKLKTINEVRSSEGLDDVEWGDNADSFSQAPGNNFNFTDPRQTDANAINSDAQDQRDQMTGKPKPKEPKDSKKKALTTDSDLILGPGEELSNEKKLRKGISTILDESRKEIIAILESQTKKDPLLEIKSIDDIPKMIKDILGIGALKIISDEVIKTEFDSGWNMGEKRIDRNIPYNEDALKFLQDYTFENIKSMTEEIKNDLKAELSRGIIDGEGIAKLTKRVNKVFDVGDVRAEAIARTETNRADNQGKLLAIKGSGMKLEKKWITHEDDRTSPICQRLDGQIVPVGENFKDPGSVWEGQSPPSHVNCRSTIIFLDPDDEKE